MYQKNEADVGTLRFDDSVVESDVGVPDLSGQTGGRFETPSIQEGVGIGEPVAVELGGSGQVAAGPECHTIKIYILRSGARTF